MPQYKYKAARRLIKHNHMMKINLLKLYDDEDLIITELRKRVIIDNKEKILKNVSHNLKILYELLNNPKRFK